MVYGERIKEYRFPTVTFSAGQDTSTNTVYTEHSINGEILEIDWKTNTAGSIYVTLSGTGYEVFRRNAPSGAGWQQTFPRTFTQASTGSIAGAFHAPWVANEPLTVNCATASGQTALSGNSYTLVVRYR